MNMPQEYRESNHGNVISNNEYEVINKFLAFYKNQSVIVADEYRQDFDIIPLETQSIRFKINEDTWKSMVFRKRIFYKGNHYVVELELWRVGHMKNNPKCLSINEFKIITNGEVHYINLDTKDIKKSNILFNIIDIFAEKKIISPEQAYSKQIYANKALQKFIENHEWQNIDIGIQQAPKLANALFIVREGFEDANDYHYAALFGTILYQLLAFRMNNLNILDEKDLRQLDELILKLRKTQLLKVQLQEKIYPQYWSGTSILLESNDNDSIIHKSQQYTVDNCELLDEYEALNQCVKSLKPKSK